MLDVRTSFLPDTGNLPLVIEPTIEEASAAELAEFAAGKRAWLDEMLHTHGGVLFRGFAIREIEQFQELSKALLPELKPYVEGQSPRTKIGDNVYTSTEFPAQYRITLHNELSYAKAPPPRIIFHCHVEPAKGGETPILDCRKAYAAMPAALRDRFEQVGVRYVKCMHGNDRGLGKSWAQHFETEDKTEVEAYLRENDIDFEWAVDGSLKTAAHRPGTTRHPVTGEPHWFNQANLWHITNVDERHRQQIIDRCGADNLPTHALYGDGTPISDQEIDEVRRVLWDNAVIFPWKQGDVLVLDNYLVAHGRMPYTPPRKILVAMG